MTELAVRNRRAAAIAGLIALGTLGLGFASVPLYRVFCQATGLNGTTSRVSEADLPKQISGETVMVRFDANTQPDLPWVFRPEKPLQQVRIGERNMAFFIAENLGKTEITGRAAFNVQPDQAGRFFKKIQCFCFTEQTLKPGERVRMPVIFFVEPGMRQDPDAKDIQQITLSYTFYPVDSPAKGS
ncbi:cytochrome c oxidase assembly protein CtaG [Sphingomonas changbaiensis NBRC 104936]|uniref:Cytochrome c oxidase assembly protein CtaG n=1 Tax=Sphingomonas changbaiensis NBRC 104936 TaxID=1219043 RepID=A0A0E9MRB2_9SPHN|nr:cytochrome c oxidase assembly protein [Sphingomonas changbaiensis]GAO39961.1 cytochrome c oxidase assembly protein CtaG [Sphingomonas changbaiensis NBRC 104936]